MAETLVNADAIDQDVIQYIAGVYIVSGRDDHESCFDILHAVLGGEPLDAVNALHVRLLADVGSRDDDTVGDSVLLPPDHGAQDLKLGRPARKRAPGKRQRRIIMDGQTHPQEWGVST